MSLPIPATSSATADNATATVTITGGSNEAIYLIRVTVEFDGTASDIPLTVKDGTTVIWQQTIQDRYGDTWEFSIPLKTSVGNDLVVELGASGTAGTSGTLHVAYGKGE